MAPFLNDSAPPPPDVTRDRPKKSKRQQFGMNAANLVAGLRGKHSSPQSKEVPTRPSQSGLEAESNVSLISQGLSVELDQSPPPPVPVKQPVGLSERQHIHRSGSITPQSHRTASRATSSAARTAETNITTPSPLPALQAKNVPFEGETLAPVSEDDPYSYDLVMPSNGSTSKHSYSLETRGEQLFSVAHLKAIFDDSSNLIKFTSFLSHHRRESLPTLIYYLDATKALRAISYANGIAEALNPLDDLEFTKQRPPTTRNSILEHKARAAFEQLAREDLPAYVTHVFINVVSMSIQRRITGTLPAHLREASEGLAEVFCLTDPSRQDNPIIFASEEFHNTTQYGVDYAIGKNCRFLQGPRTNKDSVRRIRDAIKAGKDHHETFVNYRRDGSPFLNLFMLAPLRDSRGTLRYFIGAQVDVSGLAKEATELPALQQYLEKLYGDESAEPAKEEEPEELKLLSEVFNNTEMETIRRHGGKMLRDRIDDNEDSDKFASQRPRLLLKEPSDPDHQSQDEPDMEKAARDLHGRLAGVYSHYLLLRPYPSLRILFTSPSLRVPGMLQSPFMERIGNTGRVRESLLAALAEGRSVTAKVRWTNRNETEGRNRWIHCTPLMGHNGNVGVWMVVLVDDEKADAYRQFRPAPPVDAEITQNGHANIRYDPYTGRETFSRPGTGSTDSVRLPNEVPII